MRYLLVLLLLSPVILLAQKQGQPAIDSILKALPQAKEDTTRVKLLNAISFNYRYSDPGEGIKYGTQALELATKLNWKQGMGRAENCIGINYSCTSDNAKALEHFFKAVAVYEEINDKKMMAGVLNNMGGIYCDQSDYPSALNCLSKAMKIDEEQGDNVTEKNTLSITGNVYYAQSDYLMALEYYLKSLKICEEIGDKEGISNNLNGIGNVYTSQKEYPKALEYYSKDLEILEETGNKRGIADVNTNLGCIYAAQDSDSIALKYFFTAYKIDEEIGERNDVAILSMNIGNSYANLKNYNAAILFDQNCLRIATEVGNKYLVAQDLSSIGSLYLSVADTPAAIQTLKGKITDEVAPGINIPSHTIPNGRESLINEAADDLRHSLEIAREIHAPDVKLGCYEHLAQFFKLTGNYKEALAYSDSGRAVRDTLFSADNKIKIANLETKRELALKDKQLEIDRLDIIRKRNERIFYIMGILLVTSIGGLFINRQRLKQVRMEAEKKNIEIELRIAEIEKDRAAYLLNERVKELSTIYLVNRILENESLSVDHIFNEIVKVLPPGWQYPDVCAARIVFDGNEYTTLNYAPSSFRQDAPIKTQDGKTGLIEVIYTREMPNEVEGPFLKEERDLINALANNIEVHFNKKIHEDEKARATHLLNERIKELSTIYLVNHILLDESKNANDVFNEIVNLLPPGWQYPDVCAGRIVFDGNEYTTLNYAPSAFKQNAPIKTQDGRTGLIEVIYTREMPDEAEGPFLKEERDLINALANIIEVYFNKKSNQEALAKSEANFRSSFEHAAIGMALVSIEGKWLQVNMALGEIIGYTEEELLSATFQQITHPEDLDTDLGYVQQTLDGVIDYYRLEKRYIHKNGSIVWVNLNVSLVRDEKLKPLYFVSQIEDITAKKESQQKFQDLVEKSLVGVYIIQDGRYVYVNPRIIETSGYTEEELLSTPIGQSLHKDDIEIVRKNIGARLEGKIDESRYEVRAFKKSGELMWLEMFGSTTLYRGAPAIIGTMVNITEQKKSQELIRKSQAELSAFFDNVDGSACLIDANKRYLIFNRSFIQEHKLLTGKDPIPGMEIYEFFPPDVKAKRHAQLDEVLKGNKQVIEVDYIRDGRHIYYRTTFNPVVSDGKVIGISTYSIDLSEIKNAEREILRLNRLYQFISQINESMLKLENSEQIYAEACRIAVEVGKFQMAWIGTYDKKQDKITPAAWAGVEGSYFDAIDVAGMTVSQSGMLSARAIHTKNHIYYNDIANDPVIPQHVKAEMLKRNYLSGISLPIYVNSEVVASLVLVMSEPFFFNDEEVHLIREVTDNITYALDKIRIRELHNKSEANLKSIFDTTHVSYLLLDENLSVLAYNQHLTSWYEDLTGISLALGANFRKLAAADKRENITNFWEGVLANGVSAEYETSYTKKDVTFYFTVAVRPVISNDKTIGLCIAAYDITSRKRIEMERQKMIGDLIQRNSDLEQFSYIISHNLRLPVANIIGLTEVLTMPGMDEAEEREMKGHLSTSVDKLDSVIRDLNYILEIRQDISKQEESIRFSNLLSDIIFSIKTLISDENVTIKSDFSEIDEMFTNKSYMYSIFNNLISNSIKFRQPDIQSTIEISSAKQGDQILLIFRDNGLGIDLKKRGDQIFGLYKRFHTFKEGKGMGLYMVKTQVELLGGTINVASEVNKGTEFRLQFNIA